MNLLRRLWVIGAILALPSLALAQVNYPTPGNGPRAAGAVAMCLDASSKAVACSAATPMPITGTVSGGGDATAANQVTGNNTLSAISGKLPATLGGKTAAASMAVVLSSDGPFSTQTGSVTETAPATDTASSGLNGRLQRIAQRLTTLITAVGSPATEAKQDTQITSLASILAKIIAAPATEAKQDTQITSLASAVSSLAVIDNLTGRSSATFTPAATSHTAGDVVGGAVEFTNLGPSGTVVTIMSASLSIEGATAEATAWRLCFYSATPPSAIADDGVFDRPTGDTATWRGCTDLGTAVDLGSTSWIEVHGINKPILLTGTSAFAYLINLTTLTPAAVAHIANVYAVPF